MSQVIFLVSKNAPSNELNALPSENIKSNISDGSSPSSPVGVEHACKLCRVHFYSDAEKPGMHISRVFTHTGLRFEGGICPDGVEQALALRHVLHRKCQGVRHLDK